MKPMPNLLKLLKIVTQSSVGKEWVETVDWQDRHRIIPTIVVGQHEHLQQAERAAGRVKEDVADAPADGRLAPVVVPCLAEESRVRSTGHRTPDQWEPTWGMYLMRVMTSFT